MRVLSIMPQLAVLELLGAYLALLDGAIIYVNYW